MKRFTILNETTMERLEITSEAHYLDAVEEALYTHWELTPTKGRVSWAYPFIRGAKVRFTSHGKATALVWISGNVIRVKEI